VNVGPDTLVFHGREDRSEAGCIAVVAHQSWVETVEQENDSAGGLPPFAVLHRFRIEVPDSESGPRPVPVEYRFDNRGIG
jgi:hypothetical protein